MSYAHVALAQGLRETVDAARRAHERGDTVERDRLLEAADAQCGRLINAIPKHDAERMR